MPEMQIRTGAPPAELGAPAAGELLCAVPMPEDWRAIDGPVGWRARVLARGEAEHFRVVADSGEALLHGRVSMPACGGELTLATTRLAPKDTVTINRFHAPA